MANENELKPSLLFIPDISGFTSFINEVEVDHSTRLITGLIETIIESNILDLKVSEIEGDAVLFYRFGDEPSFEELVKQAKHMFIELHYENKHTAKFLLGYLFSILVGMMLKKSLDRLGTLCEATVQENKK
jgi:Protein of unknown function (DUF2652)